MSEEQNGPITVTLAGGSSTRDVTMTFHRAGRALPIEHMFDAQGSETFDPTEAVEVVADGELFRLAVGNRITMTVEVGA